MSEESDYKFSTTMIYSNCRPIRYVIGGVTVAGYITLTGVDRDVSILMIATGTCPK